MEPRVEGPCGRGRESSSEEGKEEECSGEKGGRSRMVSGAAIRGVGEDEEEKEGE